MNIADIIAKLQKGEALTQEETQFFAAFDYSKAINDASASARRKAEKEAGEAKARADELQKAIDELQAGNATKGAEKDSEIAKLTKTVELLRQSQEATRKELEESKAAKAKMERESAIAEFAKANGIKAAANVSEKGVSDLFRLAVGDADVADADAMRVICEQFKKDNAGLIAVEGVKVPSSGKPNPAPSVENNPFAKETWNATEQVKLAISNPQKAEALAKQAGAPMPTKGA